MADIRDALAFPDWSCLAKKPFKTYHNLTHEQKLERVRKRKEREIRQCGGLDGYRAFTKAKRDEWRGNNREKYLNSVRESTRKRKLIDPGFRVQCNLRNRLKELMATCKRGGSTRISELVGCTTQQLARHLESKFKRGMTWANYGTHWHVDHVLPCSSFDHTDPKQRAQCWHWTNLEPLESKKNLEKSDTITKPQMQLLLCATH